MSGSTVGGVIGATIGFFAGGFAGAKWGWMIGSTAGAILFPPKGPDGPRLDDLKVQVSSYGMPIPRVWGAVRIAGNVIWSPGLVEHAHKEDGKGGPTSTTYSYTCSFAVLWCEGEIVGIRRKWANGKLKYDASTNNIGPIGDGKGWVGEFVEGILFLGWTLHPGSETQAVDPTIQADKPNTPAYLGYAYSVFEDLELEKFGNALPNLTAEVVAHGSYATPATVAIGSGNDWGAIDPNTGYLWTVNGTTVYVNDPVTKVVLKSIPIDWDADQIAYIPATNEFWVPKAAPALLGTDIAVISASAMELVRYVEWSGSAVRWPGAIAYSAFPIPTVYIGSVNGISDALWYFQPDGTFIGSVAGHANWNQQLLALPEDTLLLAVATAASTVELVDTYTHAVVATFSGPAFGVNLPHYIAYDPARNRLLWTGSAAGTAYAIDVVARTITTVTLTPTPAGPLQGLIYHPDLDAFIGMGSTTMTLINAETLVISKSIAQGVTANRLFVAAGLSDRVYGISSDNVARVFYLADRLTPTAVPVGDIITDLSAEVGLSAADLDVTDLTGLLCHGFVRARQGAAQASIEQLLMAFQIDAVESGGKVKYVRRAARTPVVIDADEMGLHEIGSAAPTRLLLTRADEVDLPRSVTIKYQNKDADYQHGAQTARRQTVRSVSDVTHELAVVMTDAHAMAVAEAVLYAAWAGRTTAKWSTSLRYANLEPTDLVSIDGNLIRISKRTLRGNMIEWEGALDSGQVFTTGTAGGAPEPVAQTIPYRSTTAIEFMDTALFRDQDNDAGFYIAASGYPGMDWPGFVLFKSADGGASWTEVMTLTQAATMGAASTVLGDYALNMFDVFNSVTVRLRSGTLSSISETAVLNGGNAALLGSEIIQFKTAVLNADGSYTISGLLRGRKGTPTGGHAIGERFVLLDTAAVRRVDMSTAEIGLERLYKAVTIGDTLAATTSRAFTNTAVGLECLSPVQLGGGRDASGNLTLNWLRRTRIGGEWRDYVDASLGEATESYEVEIWDSTFATLKRTIPGLAAASASYSAADQTTDFGGTQSTVYARVYQLSATVGRGFALQGSI